jgi:hypothetical protein
MGVRLDWEIESEQEQLNSNAGEDPATKRRRRAAQFRVLLGILLVLGIFAGIAGVIVWRLRTVDTEIEQLLRNTVDAEVAALRIGDQAAFLEVQRSASPDWELAQRAIFDNYQTLKINNQVQLTGRVLNAVVDKTRGRVQVEEIIDGIPYATTWFYWRYGDGWRHVPPDYTFWGNVQTIQNENISIRYQEVDAPLAQAMNQQIGGWMQTACAALTCGALPALSLEIIPDPELRTGWSANNPWQMQIPSPYATRARIDMPFSPELQIEVANLLAERLVTQTSNTLAPVNTTDAAFLRQAIVSWLVGKFVQINTNSYLINSLAETYGNDSVGRLLQTMQPNSDIGILSQVTGKALDQSGLDWRDFLTWRLTLEDQLMTARDENNFLNLYDTGDEAARNLAYGRYNAGASAESKVVVSVLPDSLSTGAAQLRALVVIGTEPNTRQEETIFRLVNGVWKRVN